MIKRGWLIGTAALLCAYAAALPAADVRTTADPQVDLGKYRSFTFLQADPQDKGAITDKMVLERLRNMIANQLGQRGYLPAGPGEAADLGVHFAGNVVPRQQVLMTGRPGPYSYGWGRAELGGQDSYAYREGTLIVDLIDVSRNQLLWRTRISEALTASYSEENWKKIDQALGEAFKKVPSRR